MKKESQPPCQGGPIEPESTSRDHVNDEQETEAFSIRSYDGGHHRILAVEGACRMGDIYGAYWLVERLYSGKEEELYDLNVSVAPALPYRFVDSGAVGIVPDAAGWGGDYSHHSRAFHDVILAHYPYVDEAAFERVREEFKEYLHRMVSYGYNGIVLDGFLEFVNFDLVGNGLEIYSSGSPYRKRHLRVAECFSELFSYARNMGMKVVLSTDMLALTGPLEDYFGRRLGGAKTRSKELWQIYGLALEELFDRLPSIDGIMIRTGEAGGVYNVEGWPYYSALGVSTTDAVQAMLRDFLPVAEKRNKKIFFRNWSVGIGSIGDLHTNPKTYEKILGKLDSESLTVSTKYGRGDFPYHLPHNPTFRNDKHRRIIEFQARREFEAFCAFPNYVGPLHQTALQDLLKEHPRIEGLWLWSQRGGPLRAGPLSLYPFHGFWPFIDANVYITGRLAWNPEADLKALTEARLRENFSNDPETIRALAQVMFLSQEAVMKGLYIGGFGRKQVRALRMDAPPNVWVWDIVSGSSVALTAVYVTCRDVLEETVAEGFEAVETVGRMKGLVFGLEPEGIVDASLYRKLLASLDYEENLLRTLAWYRKAFLYYYRWLDTGDSEAYRKWTEAHSRFREAKGEHLMIYGKDLDFPAYNFFAADMGMAIAARSVSMAWTARIILILIGGLMLAGSGLWVTPWNPFRPKEVSDADRVLVHLLPYALVTAGLLVFSSFLSHRFVVWILLSFAAFAIPLRVLQRQHAAAGLSLQAAVAGSLLFLTGITMAVVSIRGPLYFWFKFWESPLFRIVFLSLCMACILWMCFSLYAVSRKAMGNGAPRAIGMLSIAFGAVLGFNGFAAEVIGPEAFVTSLNNDMAVLPLSLSKILGMATHLNINPDLPKYAMACGAILVLGGWILLRFGKRAP
jgi:hypothetical protein